MKQCYLVTYNWSEHIARDILVLSESEEKVRETYSKYKSLDIKPVESGEMEMYSARGMERVEI